MEPASCLLWLSGGWGNPLVTRESHNCIWSISSEGISSFVVQAPSGFPQTLPHYIIFPLNLEILFSILPSSWTLNGMLHCVSKETEAWGSQELGKDEE